MSDWAIQPKAVPRKPTPTVLQVEAVECGAAALAMVLAAYGAWLPLMELRRLCGVTRDGSKATSILRAARSLGLEAKGLRVSTDSLARIAVPAIVFVNMNHFMVLEGVAQGRVYLNDPAGGRQSLSRDDFDRIYSGIALVFRPTPDFRATGTPPRLIQPLLEWLAGAQPAFAFIILCGLTLVIPGIVLPSFSRIFVDQYIVERQADWFEWLLAALVAVVLAQTILQWARGWCELALKNRISIRAATGFFRRLLRVPLPFFAQRAAGSIASRATISEYLADSASVDLTGVLIGAGSLLFFAAIMMIYSPVLTFISVGIVLAVTGLNILLLGPLREGERRAAMESVKLSERTIQGLAQIESLKASGTEDAFFERWSGQQARVANQQQMLGRVEAVLTTVPDFLRMIGSGGTLLAGGLLIMEGSVTIGILVAFQQLYLNFEMISRDLFESILELQKARGTLDQIEDVLDQPEASEFSTKDAVSPAPPQATALGRLWKLEGRIAVRDLTFGYNMLEPPLIKDFSFSAPPGSRIALVGGSGSGKSTVGKLLAGLAEPWSGDILIDGRPLRDIPRELLRNSMAAVDQDVIIFDGTVRENIALWDTTMPEERIAQAAKDAMIHDDIVRRPGGYGAQVGERGRNFSGGQRQRLEIARALLGEPSLLILDEATSALDPLVEKEVTDNIRRRGCTCIIIAHRLSTIRDCDEIIVMHRGAILQRGTHDSMIAVDGPYRRLIEN
ncbi:NHLP family bacteriocin export ABC transporter peptidase/permease/ATPase subunit [Aquabacter sp. CN5-332]|uniref:NHLP family bacteriocin export ABC transporter peptidase/permease/ATPase subunit n=1 Tax=Aquabacter sp. CN5-332 TaxID=3156608 RepID=UPI0032B56D47